MEKFEVKVVGSTAQIYTPYNPDFVRRIKSKIGGSKWNLESQCWVVPVAAVDDVRKIMLDIYGRDDTEPLQTKTVTIKYINDEYAKRAPIMAMGRIIASARDRDSGARLGDGVVLVKGKATSGGSRDNWHTWVKAGSVFKISGVVDVREDEAYEILRVTEDGVDIEALKAERENLLKRIAEINVIIGEM